MFSEVLRLDSELPLQSIVGELGVHDGELGTDGPRRSGCRDEPGDAEETPFTNIYTIDESKSVQKSEKYSGIYYFHPLRSVSELMISK